MGSHLTSFQVGEAGVINVGRGHDYSRFLTLSSSEFAHEDHDIDKS